MKRILPFLLVLLTPFAALANCNPFPVLDGGSVSTNFASITNGSSQCEVGVYLTDATGANATPSAAALADATSNPTVISFGSYSLGFNGTTWDRLRTVGTGILKTDVSTIAGTATTTGNGTTSSGTQRVTISSDSTGQVTLASGATVALVAGSASVGTVGLNSGSNVAGKFGIDQTTPGTTNAVQEIPGTTGGLSWFFLQPAASDNHTVIKNGAGQVYEIVVFNNSATVNYLRLYNAGTGFNGCNSASNLKGQFQIPASTGVGGFVVPLVGGGAAFSTGISICVTAGYSTTDTTNATATAMSVNVLYN